MNSTSPFLLLFIREKKHLQRQQFKLLTVLNSGDWIMSDCSFCLYTAYFSFRCTYLLKEVKLLSLPQVLKMWTNFFILIFILQWFRSFHDNFIDDWKLNKLINDGSNATSAANSVNPAVTSLLLVKGLEDTFSKAQLWCPLWHWLFQATTLIVQGVSIAIASLTQSPFRNRLWGRWKT